MADYQIFPLREVVFSVGNLESSANFYANYMELDIVHSGASEASLLAFWKLKEGRAYEILLQYPQTSFGQIRLIKFEGVAQQYIRSGNLVWDTGGIYDVDFRVNGVEKLYNDMRELGWHGINNPMIVKIPPFTLREMLIKGHDDVVLALVERLDPILPDLPTKQGVISHLYLTANIVRNLAVAKEFFVDKLDFKLLNETSLKNETEGESMFGLPHNVALDAKANLCIVSPDGSRDTMIDLLQFETLTGRDLSAAAVPPNRGILMYRFPVKNIKKYYEAVKKRGVKPELNLKKVIIQPYGEVQIFAVRSPDGTWIEFFE